MILEGHPSLGSPPSAVVSGGARSLGGPPRSSRFPSSGDAASAIECRCSDHASRRGRAELDGYQFHRALAIGGIARAGDAGPTDCWPVCEFRIGGALCSALASVGGDGICGPSQRLGGMGSSGFNSSGRDRGAGLDASCPRHG